MCAALLVPRLTISFLALAGAAQVAPSSVENGHAMHSSLPPSPRSKELFGLGALRKLSFVHRPIGTSDEQVVVNRDTFNEHIRGRKFQRWHDFQTAAGNQSADEVEIGGEERLAGGLSLAFAIILNVLVWCFVGYVCRVLTKWSERLAAWVAFGMLCAYGFIVNACCWSMYQDPAQRLITNFIFGLVPLAVSSASYVLALIVFDAVRPPSTAEEEGGHKQLGHALNPFQQIFFGRLIFCAAVLPGLATSVYLSGRVSTGFAEGAAHFDILSLCLFVDSGRFAGHFCYLIAPEWSIGQSPTSIRSRPGVCYVIFVVCLAWYVVLLCSVAGHGIRFLVADNTKVHTLVCLTTTVFVPLSLYLEYTGLRECEQSMPPGCSIFWWTLTVLQHALFMLMVGVAFDAVYPNLIGVALLLWAVFYTARKLSGGSLAGFVLALLPLAVIAFGVLFVAGRFRNSILHSASSSSGV